MPKKTKIMNKQMKNTDDQYTSKDNNTKKKKRS